MIREQALMLLAETSPVSPVIAIGNQVFIERERVVEVVLRAAAEYGPENLPRILNEARAAGAVERSRQLEELFDNWCAANRRSADPAMEAAMAEIHETLGDLLWPEGLRSSSAG